MATRVRSTSLRRQSWQRITAAPSLDLRFAETKSDVDAVSGQNLITFTRASSGTYFDAAGVLQTAATDVARFDHDPTTGASLGLLVEEQRANICVQSEDFSQNQAIDNVSVTTNQVIAPDGTTTADLVTSTLAATPNTCWVQQLSAVTASTATYVISCFVKQGTSPSVSLNIAMTGGTYVQAFANFNFSTKAIGLGGGGSASATAGYQQLGNGWFRLWLTLPNNNTGTGVSHRVYTRSEGSSNVVGDSVYLWGRATEAGAFPTSYIPTTTAAATRSADVASITGSNFSSWYRQDEGSIFTDSTNRETYGNSNVFPYLVQIDNGTNSNRVSLDNSVLSNGYRYNIAINNSGTLTEFSQFGLASNSARWAIGLRSSDHAFSISVLPGQITFHTASLPNAMTRMQLGIGFGKQFTGTIRRLTYWPARLSDANLRALTQ